VAHDNSSIKINMINEYWWNDDERDESKYSDKNLSQCHCVHHKSHFDWPGIEPGSPCREDGYKPAEP